MSFINKQGDPTINTKLTTIGRQLLAFGALTFTKFAVGDSEIDYQSLSTNTLNGEAVQVLRPVDNQPGVKYAIPRLAQDTDLKYSVSLPYPTDNLIVNTAKERGFFNKATLSSPYKLNTTPTFMRRALKVTGGVNGSSVITLSSADSTSIGDYLLIQWFTPSNSDSSVALGSLGTKPSAFIWYKVVGVSGSDVTLDRAVPNFGSTGNGHVYVFPGGDSIKGYYGPDSPGDYWDPNMLAFNATQNATYTDVPVWNLSIIYDASVAGAGLDMLNNTYPTKSQQGIRTYLGTNPISQPIGLLHYTNYTVENYYGEGFYKDTFTLELPTIMYHGKADNTLGLTLKAGGAKKVLTNSVNGFATPYYDLRDGNNHAVGKVFIDLKVAVIENAEILAALSYPSNRNWTLPTLRSVGIGASIFNPVFVSEAIEPTAAPVSTIWVSYRLGQGANTGAYAPNVSYGHQDTLHCLNLSAVGNVDVNTFEYLEFKLDFNELRFLRDSSNMSDGSGFVANRFFLLVQITDLDAQPQPDKWIEIDYTPNLQGYDSFANGAITRNSLSAQNYRINGSDIRKAINQRLTNTKPYYSLNYMGFSDDLTFAEEVFFLGNVTTDIQATSYQTRFSILLNNGEFATSRNPTWTPGSPIYVSEVGIYDDKDNLVAMGKLMNPLHKDAYSLRFITADLDF